jgi:hypothetical protein
MFISKCFDNLMNDNLFIYPQLEFELTEILRMPCSLRVEPPEHFPAILPDVPDMTGWPHHAKKKVIIAFMLMNYVLDEDDDEAHFVSGVNQAQMEANMEDMEDLLLLVPTHPKNFLADHTPIIDIYIAFGSTVPC